MSIIKASYFNVERDEDGDWALSWSECDSPLGYITIEDGTAVFIPYEDVCGYSLSVDELAELAGLIRIYDKCTGTV